MSAPAGLVPHELSLTRGGAPGHRSRGPAPCPQSPPAAQPRPLGPGARSGVEPALSSPRRHPVAESGPFRHRPAEDSPLPR
ncbi:MAG: hypothetical protein LBE67_17895 [Kocuria palustris]|nr:hypothetical protein [Kocuria palustris]